MNWGRNVVALTGLVILLTCFPGGAHASQTSSRKAWLRTESQTRPTASAASAGSVIGKSLLVLVAIGGGAYLLWRRSQRHPQQQPQRRAHLRVLSGTQIGPKARAVVAEVGGRLILLGVTEHSVRRLAWLESEADDSSVPEKTDSGVDTGDEPLAHRVSAQTAVHENKNTAREHRQHHQSSSFSEVLRDAVGIKPKRMQEPALMLAQATRDHVAIHAAPDQTGKEQRYVDVEGQAAGLVARLNRRT